MAATAAPFGGSSTEPTTLWLFDLNNAPITESITIAKAEMTMLLIVSFASEGGGMV